MLETFADNNSTIEEIIQYVDQICALIPPFASTCDAIAQEGVEEVVQWILQNESPTQICQQLGLCSSKVVVPVKKVDDAECTECEYVIGTIEEWLDNGSNQQEVITTIETVCTYMPEWATTCDSIIAWGVPTTVSWIEEYENASVVCQQMQSCDSQKVNKLPAAPFDDCSSCEEIVYMVEAYVYLNSSQSEIVTYLDIACQVVPQWTAQCESLIQTELPQIIQYIESNESPTQICTTLGVCSSKTANKVIDLGKILIQ